MPVRTDVVKSGKRFTTVQATLTSDGRTLLAVLGTFGDLAPTEGEGPPSRSRTCRPTSRRVEACVPLVPGESGMPPPFARRGRHPHAPR